ncbi:MAG: hypothetical protein K0R65_420 [Crocinitomicaceae bacterium]|jgi:hypothetical protein|nr:hypothetical protein [Crocinitomicaceae bacterium]
MNYKSSLIALFSVAILASCNDDLPDPDDPNIPDPNTHHMTHKVNGVSQAFLSDLNPYEWQLSYDHVQDTVSSSDSYHFSARGGLVDANSDHICYIQFNTEPIDYAYYVNNNYEMLEDICSVGSRTYSSASPYPGACVMLLHNSTVYRSDLGTQPASSVFTVTESVPFTQSSQITRTVKGTYSCRLFNENNPSEFINITEGSFHGLFSID